MAGSPITQPLMFVKNRAKAVVRRMIPAHRRFIRSGEAFLRGGEREVHELGSLIEPGSAVFDVGAHIGDYTYSLCRHVGAGGHVIAIEPLPDLARLLTRATQHLRLPVTVLGCALSSQDGEAELTAPIHDGVRRAGFASLERHGDGTGYKYRVKLRRIDDIAAQHAGGRRISFMKIDVEGHELQVLKGATETLAKHRPNLLIEIEQRHSPVPIAETFEFVTSQGYQGEFLGPDGAHLPLSAFSLARHQGDIEQAGKVSYVSNFIFRPRKSEV